MTDQDPRDPDTPDANRSAGAGRDEKAGNEHPGDEKAGSGTTPDATDSDGAGFDEAALDAELFDEELFATTDSDVPESDVPGSAGAHGAAGRSEPDRIMLYGQDAALRRKRALAGMGGALLFGAAFGGLAGLISGLVPGLVVAAVVAAALAFVVASNARRQVWLEGRTVVLRGWGIRRVDLTTAPRIELLLSDVRGSRTVSLLVTNTAQQAVKVDLAIYAGTGGRELGILALRRLADALADNTDANGLVFSELLVAQLRAEARGDGAADRPLYRIGSLAPQGKLAQRFTMEAVSRFVAQLD